MEHAREKHELSERHACRLVNQWRGTQRYLPIQRVDEDALTRDIITLASQYGRYGYRRITALLRTAAGGWGKIKLLQLQFWSKFKESIANTTTNLRLQSPRPKHWYNVATPRHT